MLISKVLDALNLQMNRELGSFYIYKSMSGWADGQGLLGTTSWLAKQAEEEKAHFEKFFNFVCDRGSVPTLLPLAQQPNDFKTLKQCFDLVVEHELMVQSWLLEVSKIAAAAEDVQTRDLLDWYLAEQVEEVKTVQDIQARLAIVGSDGTGLLLIDQELGKR